MKKKIEDYLHLYLGCKVRYEELLTMGNREIRFGILSGYYKTFIRINPIRINGLDATIIQRGVGHFEIILRHPSSLTQKEKGVIALLAPSNIHEFADTTKYLLDRHVDLYGLIEAGLALDVATLTGKELTLTQ